MQTPITDAATIDSEGGPLPPYVVDAQIAKKLETELETLKAGIARIEELHASPGKLDAELKIDPKLKEYMLKCFAEILLDAPNYTESKFELAGHVDGEAKWITVTILKSFGKTPHELRKEAEKKAEDYKSVLEHIVRQGEKSASCDFATEALTRLKNEYKPNPFN